MTLHEKIDDSQISHAIVIEECRPDSFLFKDSYERDAPITIPINRKTYFQNYVTKKRPANFSTMQVMKLFEKYATEPITWNLKRNERIISDKGYALEFRLCKKPAVASRQPAENVTFVDKFKKFFEM